MTTRPECPLVQERIPPLLENDLPPGETLLVRAHVEGCAACASQLDDYTTLVGDVRASRDASDFDAARSALTATLDRTTTKPPVLRLRPRLIAAAAAALTLGGLALLDPPMPTTNTLRVASAALTRPLDTMIQSLKRSDLSASLMADGETR